MSWEDEWNLTVWPTRGDVECTLRELIARAQISAPEITHKRFDVEDDDDDDELLGGRPGMGVDRDADVLPDNAIIQLVFQIPVNEVIPVAVRLDPAVEIDMLAQGIDPPRGDVDFDAAERAGFVTRDGDTRSLQLGAEERFTIRPDHYELAIELIAPEPDEDLPARVRIYSNEYNNREAYPVLAHLADALAVSLDKLSAFS